MTKVKICGLSDPDMIDVTISAGADAIGFVHFPKSPRHVGFDQIDMLGRHAGERAVRWVVLASPTDDLLHGLIDMFASGSGPFDGLQIHGDANDVLLREVRDAGHGPLIMRAASVATREDVEGTDLSMIYDHLLFDAKPRPDDTLPGGNGVSFDWSIMSALDQAALKRRSWFLAGGLTPENVQTAIRQSGAPAVDVSSGVESAPGVKDPARIADFIRAAKSS